MSACAVQKVAIYANNTSTRHRSLVVLAVKTHYVFSVGAIRRIDAVDIPKVARWVVLVQARFGVRHLAASVRLAASLYHRVLHRHVSHLQTL
jgi:hypothetical protein